MTKKTVIHWFRKGLRTHDNPALKECIDLIQKNPNKYVLRPIFILDEFILKSYKIGANRLRFLQQSLENLNENLEKINSKLYVISGSPEMIFQRIFNEWNVELLTFESDNIEPYSKKRDLSIEVVAFEHGVRIKTHHSHTIYNPELVLQMNQGRTPMTYQKFLSIVGNIRFIDPVEIPLALSDSSKPSADSYEIVNKRIYRTPTIEEIVKNSDELGPNKFPGGETEALNRLSSILKRTQYVCDFEKPNTSPNSLEPSTTVLSPYLKFGCLSSRYFYKKLKEVLDKNPKHSKPPTSLMGQLLWREFYYTAAASETNFDKMVGNSLCIQIPWNKNEEHLSAWANGLTGYPFIDAIMRQLRQEGWIHHLARHSVACFLTRGDLWISWEEGMKVFDELLLDSDWALNAGNWMWLSASAFFYKYFRVYSPVAFGKKTDPQGNYIRKYCPELKNYPSGTIYEPWKVSLDAQKLYRCVIGKDYPERIVVHEVISKVNLGKMAAAYKKNRLSKLGIDDNESDEIEKKRKAKGPGSTSKKSKN